MAARIYRGSFEAEPRTISKPVSGALLPGTFVAITSTIAQATALSGARVGILGSRDMWSGDADTAYASGDTGIAYRLRPGFEFQAQVAAATYTYGQELTVGASGRLVAAATGNVVVAFFDDKVKSGVAQSAGALCDIVIANAYTKP